MGIGGRLGCVLVLAATATACGSGHGAPVVVRHSALPLYSGMQGQRGVGTGDVAAIAGVSRLVVGTPRQLRALGGQIARADPGVRVFVYVNAMLSRPDERFPPSWYLHDAAGRPVRSLVQGNALMDPASTLVYRGVRGWADHVRRTCAAALRAVPAATGCFLDMVGPAPLRPGYNRGHVVPVDPATRRPFSAGAYLAATGGLARTVQKRTGRPVIGNGLESGEHYYHGTSVLGRYMGGLEVEHWMGVGNWQAKNPALWRQNVQMVIDEGRAGRTLLVNLHPPADGNPGPWPEFGLASFLLGYTGSEYFQFSLGPGHPSWRNFPPGYGVDIGAPAEHRSRVQAYARHGVYERRFTHGLVIVNPSDRTVGVTLPGRYEMPHGRPRSRIVLRPMAGVVLRAVP